MSSSNCCFLTCIQISQEAGQVVWYSHLFQNFPQYFVIHTVKGFGIVNKLVPQSCSTLCNPMDCNPPGSSVHGIVHGQWVAILFFRGSPQPRDQTQVSHIADGFFTIWATREALMQFVPLFAEICLYLLCFSVIKLT